MKITTAALLLLSVSSASLGKSDWQEIQVATVNEVASHFAEPPMGARAIHWAIWGGQQTKERILTDIERVHASGAGVFMINNSRGLTPKYFTPEYMELVKFAVEECKKRDMKVWIEGDAGYPDGFAGGMISRDFPQLGMQGIVADARYSIAAGQTLKTPLPSGTLGIFAVERGEAGQATAANATPIPWPPDRKLKWTGPSGATWEVTLHGAAFDRHFSVVAGQTLSIDVPLDVKSIDASQRAGGRGRAARSNPATLIPVPADGSLQWTAPATGAWDVTFVRHVYRSSPTRFVDREDGTNDKDSLYSLIDYLDPEATATYLKVIHAQYEKLLGDEFGKTIMGFRGDEPDYTGFMPWTPRLLEVFKSQKGYDLQPFIVQFFSGEMSTDALRAKADLWDVWSGMFRDNFFRPQEEWCKARGMEYMLHVNHEELMLAPGRGEDLIHNEGSFFRDMRFVGVPGVDNLNQISPGVVADFPKLAGSTAHLYGRPQVWSEEGGGTGRSGKFVFDYQLVRGINYPNMRGLNSAAAAATALQDPAVAMGHYSSRASYLMQMGRPAAQVALYHPTDSMWLGDAQADIDTMKLTTQLMENQIDFDHIDHDALASVCTLDGGGLKNLSGQVYRAVVVPTSTVIEKNVLDRLRAFAGAGGKVVFVGRTPTMIVNQSFLYPEAGAPDLSFATIEPTAEITARVIASLPQPDVKLDAACPAIKYMHRALADGEVYFFFNESAQSQARTATLAGAGQVQIWDAADGAIHPIVSLDAPAGHVAVPLNLGPQESRFVVIGPQPATAAAAFPRFTNGQALKDPWQITLGTRAVSGDLKPWQELGEAAFTGTAHYQTEFTTGAGADQSKPAYIDLGNVREVARISINGVKFEARGWPPYAWDVTRAIKAGANTLEVDVQVPVAQARGNFGGAGAAGTGTGGGRVRGAGGAGGAAPGGQATSNPALTGTAGANLIIAAPPAGLLGPVTLYRD